MDSVCNAVTMLMRDMLLNEKSEVAGLDNS